VTVGDAQIQIEGSVEFVAEYCEKLGLSSLAARAANATPAASQAIPQETDAADTPAASPAPNAEMAFDDFVDVHGEEPTNGQLIMIAGQFLSRDSPTREFLSKDASDLLISAGHHIPNMSAAAHGLFSRKKAWLRKLGGGRYQLTKRGVAQIGKWREAPASNGD
jgi:hypothetical protein